MKIHLGKEVTAEDVEDMVRALKLVSFYAHINHGSKCKDYGEVVDLVLEKLGIEKGKP